MVAKAIGWGIVIYAVMYLAWSGLVIYGLSLGYLSLVLRLVVLYFITNIAARSMRLFNAKDLLAYAALWAIAAAILDAVFLVPFSGWGLYASLSVWFGYALIIAMPVAGSYWRRRSASAHLA
jgi:hypothetical protein